MKIIVDRAIPFIENRFPEDVKVTYLPGNEISPEIVKDADALIVRTRTRCDKDLLEGSKVKLVATATIGTDHIDIPWCEANGITVKSAPGCNAPGVAQYVLSSLFSIGFNPESHTLGIVGHGNVGSIVAEWAQQMGINILVCDPPRKEAAFRDVEYHDIEEVLRKSDAVTFHVPLTKDGEYPTFRMIGERELEYMKPGAILVNSSRGGVVDEEALKKELRRGRLKAVIDTWENEPYIDPQLVKLAEIATPHIAGYSAQGKMRGTRMALEAVSKALSISVDLSGLECTPNPESRITRSLIQSSYNPRVDHTSLTKSLIQNPPVVPVSTEGGIPRSLSSSFESLRNNYSYRPEPLFLYP